MNDVASVWDDDPCTLGEGLLWHPQRDELLWFDIPRGRLHLRGADGRRHLQFEEKVSAAAWIDADHVLVASETRLMRVALDTGRTEDVCALEADDPRTRSNDGRADPWGGFWIGTMDRDARSGAGTLYRFYRGALHPLCTGLTINNATCFAPDGRHAYYADTPTGQVLRQPLDPEEGWPTGAPELWLDLSTEGLNPDGAVTDAAGNVWNAQFGAGRVAAYTPAGRFLGATTVPAANTTCPAFGGEELSTLFCTTAREGLTAADLAARPDSGKTFAAPGVGQGRPEPRVLL